MVSKMVQYLHFRILELPLNLPSIILSLFFSLVWFFMSSQFGMKPDIWRLEDLPICSLLEEHFPIIQEDDMAPWHHGQPIMEPYGINEWLVVWNMAGL